MKLFAACLLCLAFVAGCDDVETVDPRYSTPERTIDTMLSAYGLEHVSPDEGRRLRRAGQLRLRDAEHYRACFDRFNGAGDEALAGYVVGSVVENRDALRTSIANDKARVMAAQGAPVILYRRRGGWRISLDESVPQPYRGQLLEVARRAGERVRAQGGY